MAKLSSLEDLRSLLSDTEGSAQPDKAKPAPQKPRTGYTGKELKLDVSLDSRKRRGKTVTLITGFQSRPGELEEIVQDLKRVCGTGGRALDNEIELQGDHRAKAVEKLKGMGYTVRSR